MKRIMTDPFEPVGPAEEQPDAPLWKRLAWFFGIALASGAAVAVVAYLLRGALFLETGG